MHHGVVQMWMLASVLTVDDEPVAHSVQAGRSRQAVYGPGQRVGDEPRVTVDLNDGQPLFAADGAVVGERVRHGVRLWDVDYDVRRHWWHTALHVDVRVGDEPVLTVRACSRPGMTVHRYDVDLAPGLDPVVTLALVVVVARPDRMGVLTELLR